MKILSPTKMVLIGVLLVVGACSGTPVYNAEGQPFAANRPLQITDIEKAIRRAAASRGWTIKKLGAGKMEGRLAIRRHVALVDITYNLREFSITYKDSQNLKYTGSTIHKNYNSWVQNLAKDINSQVSLL